MYLKKKLSSCWQLCINLLPPSLPVTSNRILRSKWCLWAQKTKKALWNASGNGRYPWCICQSTKGTGTSNSNSFHLLAQPHLTPGAQTSRGPAKRALPWCCTWENKRCLRPEGGETALGQMHSPLALLEGAPTLWLHQHGGTYSCCSRSLKWIISTMTWTFSLAAEQRSCFR